MKNQHRPWSPEDDQALRAGQRRQYARPSIAEIRRSVATHYGLDERELMSADTHRRVAWPRQTAMYFARRLTGRPFAVIARHLGGRHYSTIIWGCRKVEARMKTDTSQQIEVEHMARRIIREKHG